ncbi:hypothetical protein JCM11641_004422 [Rhodosporidiobolus odoratus]
MSLSSTPSTSSSSPPRTLAVGGLPLHIYGLDSLPTPSSSSSDSHPPGLAILFLLHGRLSSASHPLIPHFAQTLLSHAHAQPSEPSGERPKDLVVVAFDQRNHGQREVDKERNLGWKEGRKQRKQREKHGLEKEDKDEVENVTHAADMLAIQTGTAADVSHLITFLPSLLFPNDERQVTDWYCAGISLGGHATWIALADDPRITLGIPIIASPSTLTLLTHRASRLPPPLGPLPLTGPYFPRTLLSTFSNVDPASRSTEEIKQRYKGRKVLVMSGREDGLVNFVEGGGESFVERLRREGGLERLEVWVQEETGHKCTPEMMQRAAEFVYTHGLTAGSSSGGGAEGGAKM